MPEDDHPGPAELGRFVRGELPREKTHGIVRHLLAGCPRCRAVTRRLWELGDALPPDPEPEEGLGS